MIAHAVDSGTDRRERRTQIVRNRREKLAFEAIGAAQDLDLMRGL
jgi:hypothetical protein